VRGKKVIDTFHFMEWCWSRRKLGQEGRGAKRSPGLPLFPSFTNFVEGVKGEVCRFSSMKIGPPPGGASSIKSLKFVL
jgi:hypothetical protein